MFRLPRLPSAQPAWGSFQLWWQRVVEAIERQETAQDTTIKRIRRLISHTVPTTIIKATENGTSVTLQVLPHTRVYADGTEVSIEGSTPQSGFLPGTLYGCYYDDESLSDTSPMFIFTTSLEEAQAAKAEGRHWCGMIQTPALASGHVVESGGAYPGGAATIGGELRAALE